MDYLFVCQLFIQFIWNFKLCGYDCDSYSPVIDTDLFRILRHGCDCDGVIKLKLSIRWDMFCFIWFLLSYLICCFSLLLWCLLISFMMLIHFFYVHMIIRSFVLSEQYCINEIYWYGAIGRRIKSRCVWIKCGAFGGI